MSHSEASAVTLAGKEKQVQGSDIGTQEELLSWNSLRFHIPLSI